MNLKSIDFFNTISNQLKIKYTILNEEQWNKEYEALNLKINNTICKSRLAKKTSKKPGYFVTLWTKDENDINQPFDYAKFPEKLIVNIIDEPRCGQFIFPREILLDKSILTCNLKLGKMAFRVYPRWVKQLNPTAFKTQQWQSKYFIDLTEDIEQEKILKLL